MKSSYLNCDIIIGVLCNCRNLSEGRRDGKFKDASVVVNSRALEMNRIADFAAGTESTGEQVFICLRIVSGSIPGCLKVELGFCMCKGSELPVILVMLCCKFTKC